MVFKFYSFFSFLFLLLYPSFGLELPELSILTLHIDIIKIPYKEHKLTVGKINFVVSNPQYGTGIANI